MDNYSEIEERLEEANAIKELLKKSFIGKKENRSAYLRLEEKIRTFLALELEKLFGIKGEESSLDKNELGALKILAGRLTKTESKPMEVAKEENLTTTEEKEFVEFTVNGETFKKETNIRAQTLPANYAPPPTGSDQYQLLEQQMNNRSVGKDFSSQIKNLVFNNIQLVDGE